MITYTRSFSDDNSFRIMLPCNYEKLSNLSLGLTTNKDEWRQDMNLNIDSFLAVTKDLRLKSMLFILSHWLYFKSFVPYLYKIVNLENLNSKATI